MKKKILIILLILVSFLAGYFSVKFLVPDPIKENTNTTQFQNAETQTTNVIKNSKLSNKLESLYPTGGIILAFPEFNNINEENNEALDNWIWYTVRKQFDSNEKEFLTSDEILKTSKEIFGKNFNKTISKDGNYYLPSVDTDYNFEDKEKVPNSYSLVSYCENSETKNNNYIILDSIEKDNLYTIKIIEYATVTDTVPLDVGQELTLSLFNKSTDVKDYDAKVKEDYSLEIYDIQTKNKITDDDISKYIIRNKDKFEQKELVFEYDTSTDNYYIVSSKNI